MLDRVHRLRRRSEFTAAVRAGRRSGRATLVVHFRREAPDPRPVDGPTDAPAPPAKAGFIVSRSVGGAVVRNTVRRRLRHLVRPYLADLPPGSLLVVRALPPAARANSARLAADLAAALRSVIRPGPAKVAGPSVRPADATGPSVRPADAAGTSSRPAPESPA